MSSFSGLPTGDGFSGAGPARTGGLFVAARVRAEAGSAAYAATRATSFGRLESTVAEPGDRGVSHALQQFWAGWESVGNDPGSAALRTTLIDDAAALTRRISAGHEATTTQWQQTRAELDAAVVDVRSSAAAIAELNRAIRGVVAGGAAIELVDQRSVLIAGLCALVGASSVQRADGTVDVLIGGNALVRGDRSDTIAVSPGSHGMGQRVALTWGGTGHPLVVRSGTLAGMLTALTPAAGGHGGILAEAGAQYDWLATTLVNQVNAQHALGRTAAGTPGGAIFTARHTAGGYQAANLAVAIADPAAIAVGVPGGGSLDGSMGDAMAQLGSSPTGPDAQWTAFVVDLGVSSRSALKRATIAAGTRSTAEDLSNTRVDVDADDEAVSMLAYQDAYEGAARVVATIDSMHAALISRTAKADLRNRLSDRTRIAKPSDDPAGTATAITLRAALRANQQATRNLSDGNGWLTTADTALSSSLDLVRRGRELTVRGANGGGLNPSAREDLALQVEVIRDTLVARSNSTYRGRSVFAGTSDGGAAVAATNAPDPAVPGSTRTYAPQGVVGSSVERRIGPRTLLRVDVDATQTFGQDGAPGPGSVFQTLDRVAKTLRDGGELTPELATLDGHRDALLTQLCAIGARQSRALGAETTLRATTIQLTTRLSGLEDVDLAVSIVDLQLQRQLQKAAYAAALGATARALQPSLLDFLK